MISKKLNHRGQGACLSPQQKPCEGCAPMHVRPLGNRTFPGKLLSLLLVFSLLFAALHVSQHGLEEGGGPAGHSECQLSHVPGALWCVPAPPALLLVLVFVLALNTVSSHSQTSLRLQRIRAPPLPS